MKLLIENNATVLFQGDSITDADRQRANPAALGRGYAAIAAGWLGALYPTAGIRFLNRGISGHRCADLAQRWEEDCIALRPTWVSIMIGINDTWRAFDRNDPTTPEAYETSYRAMLTRTREALNARLILIDPFVLPHPADRLAWRKDVDARIAVVARLATEFNAIRIPMDAVFAATGGQVAPAHWADDGVHPTPAGHALIAQTWLRAVGAIAPDHP